MVDYVSQRHIWNVSFQIDFFFHGIMSGFQGTCQKSVSVDGLLKVRRWPAARQRGRKLKKRRQQR